MRRTTCGIRAADRSGDEVRAGLRQDVEAGAASAGDRTRPNRPEDRGGLRTGLARAVPPAEGAGACGPAA